MRSFMQSPGIVYAVDEIKQQTEPFGEWERVCDFTFDQIDWHFFLDGCGEHPFHLEDNAEATSKYRPTFPLAALFQAVSMFHRAGSHRQALPLHGEIVDHLLKMRSATLKLADLAQGGEGRGEPSQTPEWADDESGVNIQSDGSLENNRRRAASAVHPVLHELLVQALEDSNTNAGSMTNQQYWSQISILFQFIQVLPEWLGTAANLVRGADPGDVSPAHRSANLPRRWARCRLLWIWRDLIGREIRLSLKDPSEHTTVDTPEPNDCVRFMIDALEKIYPVRPHNYPALIRDLRRASEEIPESNLLLTVK